MTNQKQSVFIILSLLALASFAQADEVKRVGDRSPEEQKEIREKLEIMINLLCNVETKKYLVANHADMKVMKGDTRWEQFYKKMVAVLMQGCVDDLNLPGHLDRVLAAITEEERQKIIFPMAERIKVEHVKSLSNYDLNEKEQALHALFTKVDDDMARQKHGQSESSL